MLPVILASVAAIAYGLSDFAGGFACRSAPVPAVMTTACATSSVAVAGLAVLHPGRLSVSGIALGVACGAVLSVGMAAFFTALARGPFAVVSPTTAVLAAALPVAVAAGRGDHLDSVQVLAVLTGLFAVWLISSGGSVAGAGGGAVGLAVLAGACFGAGYLALAGLAASGGYAEVAASRVTALTLVGVVAWRRRSRSGRGLSGSTLRLGLLVGLADSVAYVATVRAFGAGSLAPVAVVIALYPAVTVLLAARIAREPVHPHQRIGLVAALIACAGLGVSG